MTGNTAGGNTGDGIQVGSASNVIGNTVRNNMGFGLELNTTTAYSQNVMSNNMDGEVNGVFRVGVIYAMALPARDRSPSRGAVPSPARHVIPYSSSISASKLTSSAARFSKRVYSEKNVSGTVPVGPLRCLPMIISASRSSAFFGS